jgi:hypothetical protein
MLVDRLPVALDEVAEGLPARLGVRVPDALDTECPRESALRRQVRFTSFWFQNAEIQDLTPISYRPMAPRPMDAHIDRRTTCATSDGGSHASRRVWQRGADIRRLQKPPLAAWAINQVYWKRRAAYDALIDASKALRAAHASILGGKRADLRAASNAHEEALETALKAALAILQDAGHPAADSTKQIVATTLRARPTTDPHGRLSRTLQPGGFEQLADLPIRLGRGRLPSMEPKRDAKPARSAETSGAQAKALTRAKETVVILTRALRSAEQTSRQEEFEAARAVREADRAAERANAARHALDAAQEALAKAEREEAAAVRKKEATARRAREAEEALTVAQVRADAAQKELTQAQKK